MIVTPEQLIKQYFPEPIETTRELYDRLDLESVYPYLDWLRDAEQHCLSKFTDEVDYRLLPDAEKNYWIGERVFGRLFKAALQKYATRSERICRNLPAKWRLTEDMPGSTGKCWIRNMALKKWNPGFPKS
jgi:hypothetical protein